MTSEASQTAIPTAVGFGRRTTGATVAPIRPHYAGHAKGPGRGGGAARRRPSAPPGRRVEPARGATTVPRMGPLAAVDLSLAVDPVALVVIGLGLLWYARGVRRVARAGGHWPARRSIAAVTAAVAALLASN